jgi:hypothetical protein
MGLSQVRGGAKHHTNDAKEMGAHLAKYLKKLHGAGYARTFGRGFHAVDSDSGSDGEDNQHLEGGNISRSGRYEGMGGTGGCDGGRMTASQRAASNASKMERNEMAMAAARAPPAGGARSAAMRVQLRKPVGAGDGRRKRAEVVKKVMSEKGLSMIEASKYVKAHGLY